MGRRRDLCVACSTRDEMSPKDGIGRQLGVVHAARFEGSEGLSRYKLGATAMNTKTGHRVLKQLAGPGAARRICWHLFPILLFSVSCAWLFNDIIVFFRNFTKSPGPSCQIPTVPGKPWARIQGALNYTTAKDKPSTSFLP